MHHAAILLVLLCFLWLPAVARGACVGDCNADASVSVDEIVVAVAIALGGASLDTCSAIDRNRDGEATIDEILACVQHALDGCGGPTPTPTPPEWHFTEVSAAAGVAFVHQASPSSTDENVAGVAVADYDGDGWLDVHAVGGDAGVDRLFRNRGDGSFEDRSQSSGVIASERRSAGPAFADVDGDGDADLFVGGIDGSSPQLWRNRGDGTFTDITSSAGLGLSVNVVGAAFGDCEGDGDLDLALAHWGEFLDGRPPLAHLWHNDGSGNFVPAPASSGLQDLGSGHPEIPAALFDWTFAPNFVDLDGDGDADLVYAADYGSSRAFLNRGDCTFDEVTTPAISDENGMGSTLGDYDGDGDMDWFVTSIHDPDGVAQGHWGVSGNRLYRNDGGGLFSDVTQVMGVADGGWGWGACFADFDNDGHLDLFHVNGFGPANDAFFAEFNHVPARLFRNQAGAGFVEEAAQRGIDDRGSGRGVACADYDRDGDIDVFISNHNGPFRLYRNDGGAEQAHLTVRVVDETAGPAIGARVEVRTGERTQVRQIRAGNNYVSQDPAEAHFGLGAASIVDEVRVFHRGHVWSSGPLAARQSLVVRAW